ncbi:MAG: CHASE2 domain-containing protein [Phormidesmis sp.]
MTEVYRLKVTQVEQVCLFELNWGQGLHLRAKLPYPTQVEALYQKWQRIYLRYYQALGDEPSLRGRKVTSGQMAATTDWHSQLVQSETNLLMEFRQWLNDAKLIEIRRTLSYPAHNTVHQPNAGQPKRQPKPNAEPPVAHEIDLLLTCDPIGLERLPWETWELGSEFSTRHSVRISRLPIHVRTAAVQPVIQKKARVLVILGDDTGLNFDKEREALSALSHLISVEFVGWRANVNATNIKQDIVEIIQSPLGWDMLLFFGHSNEASLVGGQIAVAPNTTLSIKELEPCLRQAKANGLKFALFNSCKGIDIASALIDMGLNQVAVMREPIHNRVAQIFLVQFLQHLSQFEDVHTALRKASQALYAKNLTYPSAYLVPSLFRHSNASLFRLQPSGRQAWFRALLPQSKSQLVGFVFLSLLSLTAPVTQVLLNYRLWTQALYRQAIHHPIKEQTPPVLLVQIDRESIRRGIADGVAMPMNRAYLADILDRLSELRAEVIGVDYLLDGAQVENDAQFAQSSRQAVSQGSWLVFSSILEGAGQEVGVREELASLNWAMQGHVHTPKWYLRALAYDGNCEKKCPYSYLLAMTQLVQKDPSIANIQPSLQNEQDLRQQLLKVLEDLQQNKATKNKKLRSLYEFRLSLWTAISRLWNQRWLHPVLDFSIPPEQIFTRLSAYELLEASDRELLTPFDQTKQIVIIASGGYGEAGTDYAKDYSPLPPAIAYWHRRRNDSPRYFTGGEANAYAVHHFLKEHYVTPIPDLWLTLIGALAGANLVLLFVRWQLSSQKRLLFLCITSFFYGWISLQLYVGLAIILPYVLPVSVVWLYCIPSLKNPQLKSTQ